MEEDWTLLCSCNDIHYKKIMQNYNETYYSINKKKIYINENGNIYVGQLNNYMKNGNGVMKYTNGDVYVGGWEDNKKNRFGIMKYENGDIYEGEWKDNKKNGQGKKVYKMEIYMKANGRTIK
jgi:hypothetical protein